MSKYADEGTVAHALAAAALTEGRPASAYINRVFRCEDYEHSPLSPSAAHRWMRCPGSTALETRIAFKPRVFGDEFPVTRDMADDVQVYLDRIAEYLAGAGEGAEMKVEQRVDISEVIGVPEHGGTADVVILSPLHSEIQVHDLKFGRGVQVDADENEQLMMYAAGLLLQYDLVGGWDSFCLVIHQPRIGHLSEWRTTRERIERFMLDARSASSACAVAATAEDATPYLNPGEKQCRFCNAKATCPALAKRVEEEVGATFRDLDEAQATGRDISLGMDVATLAQKLAAVPLIDAWCKAVAAHAEALALAGETIPGFKLVAGRKGSRKWTSEAEAEAELKRMRVKHDEMYDYSVISPTTAEKRFAKEHPRQWSKLSTLVTQADGKPSLVPESDKRPAITVAPVAFANLDAEALV